MGKSALGRGLGELLGEVETAYEQNDHTPKIETDNNEIADSVIELDISSIEPNPTQPRKVFDEVKLKELSKSIVRHGLIQPITVIKNEETDGYILIAGERRLRASKLAELEKIKAIILTLEELEMREIALIENIQREDLNIIELAYSYAQLINEHSLTHEELSNRVAKSRTSITNTLRLLTLSVYAQQMLSSDKISAGHAKVMIGLDDDQQKIVVDTVIGQKLSVRETEKLVREMKNPVIKNSNNKEVDYNLEPLNEIAEKFKSKDLKVKITPKYLKIDISSQEDIDLISKYFSTLQ